MSTPLSLPTASPHAYQAMLDLSQAAAEHLDQRLGALIGVRVSQINGCAYCIDLHTRQARTAGDDEHRLYALNAWRRTTFFTERERAALALAEALTEIAGKDELDAAYAGAAAVFDAVEQAHLLWTIAAVNAWNRVAIATGLEPPNQTAVAATPAPALVG